jgi:integrase
MSAGAIILQGDLYLRPHEILGLRKKAVLKPVSSRSKYGGVVLAQQEDEVLTKTGTYDDCVLLDTVCRSDVQIVLKSLYNKTATKESYLFPALTMSSYAVDISRACEGLGLGRLKLTPHGLRHSGPSTDSLHRIRDITTIQARARWKSPSSVARYKKPGRMFLLHQFVPSDFWRKAEKCRAKVIGAFHK